MNAFRQASLAIKLLCTVGVLLVLVTLAFLLYSNWSLGRSEQIIVGEVSEQLEQQVVTGLRAQAGQQAAEVAAAIEMVYQYPRVLAAQLAQTIEDGGEQALSRQQVQDLVRYTLSVSPSSSMYAQFEDNGFHNSDENFLSGFSHSVDGHGSLEVYYVREPDGALVLEEVDDADEKHDTSMDEFGFRAAEWYLCAMEKRRPCITNPYNYEIRPGYEELMTSLVVPIMAKGRFRGVVGADMNLPILQTRAKELAASLFDGQSKVYLVSQDGFLAAATDGEQKLARPFSELMDTKDAERLMALSESDTASRIGAYLYVAQPINIKTASTQWQLIIGVDYQAAMAAVGAVSKSIGNEVSALLTQLFIIALILVAASLVIVWLFTQSIVSPLRLVSDRMKQLAGQGGDLTQSMEVSTHAELISLADGFNQFQDKIRSLLDSVKSSSREVAGSAGETQGFARNTSDQISRQHQEIDSVVTAITEMSSTAADVAKHANEAADSAQAVRESANTTEQKLKYAVDEVSRLSEDMGKASDAVGRVSGRSEDIRKILDVIGAIAEQTNLLALNAAIEAARAGDHGRGFSVVADEVRALASKTAGSVEEISNVIAGLQAEVKTTVSVIDENSGRATSTAEKSEEAFKDLTVIVTEVGNISDRIMQMATAAEEQSVVSEELNQNMVSIGDATSQVAELAKSSMHSAQDISDCVEQLKQQLDKLKTE